MTVDGELYDGRFELYLRSVPEKSLIWNFLNAVLNISCFY
jgi:hypothetical protein